MESLSVKVRQPNLSLIYEGHDISANVINMVESFSYVDYAHGRADEIRVTLDNTKGEWTGSWTPEEGDTLAPSLVCTDWDKPGDTQKLDCGTFKITGVRSSGPPDQVEIIADSALITKALRSQKNTESFEHISFREVCRELAGRHGLTLFFEGDGEGMSFDHVEQDHESDLSFLQRLAEKCGFNLKLAEEKLIVFQGRTYDARSPVMTLARGEQRIKSRDLSSKVRDVYSSCKVEYLDPLSGELRHYEFQPPDPPPVNQVLRIKRRTETEEQAAKMAKSQLRYKNKQQISGTIVLAGTPGLLAGVNIRLSGFGTFDRVYFIESAEHTFGRHQGYETRLQIRHVLTGY